MTGVPLHLFLTGEIQVGKSTIVSSVVSRLGVPVSWVSDGFCFSGRRGVGCVFDSCVGVVV